MENANRRRHVQQLSLQEACRPRRLARRATAASRKATRQEQGDNTRRVAQEGFAATARSSARENCQHQEGDGDKGDPAPEEGGGEEAAQAAAAGDSCHETAHSAGTGGFG